MDPTSSILPYIYFSVATVAAVSLARRTTPLAAVLATAAGAFLGIVLARIGSDLVSGRRIDRDVARSLIETASVVSGTVLVLITVDITSGALAIAVLLDTLLAWGASAYLQIAFERVKAHNSLNRDFGVSIHPNTRFTKAIWFGLQVGIPVPVLSYLFRYGASLGFAANENRKELAKLSSTLLSLQHEDEAVIEIARGYNRSHEPESDGYSRALTTQEANALMWRGEFTEATELIRRAIIREPPNPYFRYTLSRILWHQGACRDALAELDTALEKFVGLRGYDCLPGNAHKAYFLGELALDRLFQNDEGGYLEFLAQAESALAVLRGYARFQRQHDLIYSEANLLLLRAWGQPHRGGYYRSATEHLLWCLWNGVNVGARVRLALLHSIGVRDRRQAVTYMKWARRAVEARGYSPQLPFVRRIGELTNELERIQGSGIILTDRILVLQSTSEHAPSIEYAIANGGDERDRAEGEAIRMRESIFRNLSVAWRPVPLSEAFELPV